MSYHVSEHLLAAIERARAGRSVGDRAESRVEFGQCKTHGQYWMLKPTVVISNKAPDEIRAYLDDAAYDRLREGGGLLVSSDWGSHHGKGSATMGKLNAAGWFWISYFALLVTVAVMVAW